MRDLPKVMTKLEWEERILGFLFFLAFFVCIILISTSYTYLIREVFKWSS